MAKRNWKKRLDIGAFTTELVFGNFFFVLFLGFLGVIYIANAHLAERRIRDVQALEKDIRQLKWEYMSIKRAVLLQTMQSEIDDKVEGDGLLLGANGPKVILKKR